MGEPVLVIHGVSNRDPAAFEALVHDLSNSLAGAWDLIPAFWGDLGGNPLGVADTIPDPAASAVRRAPDVVDESVAMALLALESPTVGAEVARSTARAAIDKRNVVADAAVERVAGPETGTRGVTPADDVRLAIGEHWDAMQWLPLIQDEALLRLIGQVIGGTLGRMSDGSVVGGAERRGLGDVSGSVKGLLSDLDRAVGALIGRAAGNFNRYFREHLLPTLVGFAGDVFVYEHQYPKIQERVRGILDEHVPGYGNEGQPISVIAHSLGGMIAFDMAVAGEPRLWISALITFGSQSPFFHVVDPRGGGLVSYLPGHPVTLPATIEEWTNLWEPLDPLAFIAAKVFKLHAGHSPSDRPVHHLASSGLWTHSVYWHHPDLVSAIRETLA